MRPLFVLLSVLGMSMVGFAQIPAPGTFSTLPAQSTTSIFAPVLSTPTATLSNGLTPGVVTNQPTYVVSAPQNTQFVPMNVPSGNDADYGISEDNGTASEGQGTLVVAGRRRYFDFIVAGDGNTSYNAPSQDSSSLGEIATSLRRTPKPSVPVYTNDDITRMNQKYGSANTTPNPTLDASSDN